MAVDSVIRDLRRRNPRRGWRFDPETEVISVEEPGAEARTVRGKNGVWVCAVRYEDGELGVGLIMAVEGRPHPLTVAEILDAGAAAELRDLLGG